MSTNSEHIIIPISPIPPRVQIILPRRQVQNYKNPNKCCEKMYKCCRGFNDLPILIKLIIIFLAILILGALGFSMYLGISLGKLVT